MSQKSKQRWSKRHSKPQEKTNKGQCCWQTLWLKKGNQLLMAASNQKQVSDKNKRLKKKESLGIRTWRNGTRKWGLKNIACLYFCLLAAHGKYRQCIQSSLKIKLGDWRPCVSLFLQFHGMKSNCSWCLWGHTRPRPLIPSWCTVMKCSFSWPVQVETVSFPSISCPE